MMQFIVNPANFFVHTIHYLKTRLIKIYMRNESLSKNL